MLLRIIKLGGLPNGYENFILSRIGERARVDISGHVACFDGLEIDEDLFRIDPADVHLASVRTKQGVVSPVLAGGRWGLWSTPFCFLSR
jgi:hypothetical protein